MGNDIIEKILPAVPGYVVIWCVSVGTVLVGAYFLVNSCHAL